MLMQIAEPGQSTVKEACKPRVVGIDLGTTNSLVAHVDDAAPAVLGDDPIVPSVVYYGRRRRRRRARARRRTRSRRRARRWRR